ncbi:MAG: YiiD C-terminal domain-containing protein [Alphaproteobacteria bacterium]|nr:YiiD C-terminal domain-containing protein [Alphaproteobacteria bacterium]
MADKEALEAYLYKNIPLSMAMGVRVLDADKKEVVLSAPLSANINHKRTAFGGSLQAIATLSCWTLMHLNLKDTVKASEIVITASTIDYIRPVTSDFSAHATRPDKKRWEQFLKTFDRHGKARIQLTAHIMQGEDLAIDYTGSFAALRAN